MKQKQNSKNFQNEMFQPAHPLRVLNKFSSLQVLPIILSPDQVSCETFKEMSEQTKLRQNVLGTKEEEEEGQDQDDEEEGKKARKRSNKLIRDRVMDIIQEMLELNVI